MIINEKLFNIPQGHSRHSSSLSGVVSVLEIKLGDMNWEVSVFRARRAGQTLSQFARSFFWGLELQHEVPAGSGGSLFSPGEQNSKSEKLLEVADRMHEIEGEELIYIGGGGQVGNH